VALIAELRWRAFRNSLRTTSAKLDLFALILTTILGSVLVLGLGVAIAAGGYFFTARGRAGQLALLLWAIFFAWHVFPILAAASTARFDFRNLLRFPLRFSVFFLLSLAYSLFDPAALAALIWLACLAAGLALARADLLPWALVVLTVFAAMNLLLSRMIHTWLERLLGRRRTREALWAIVLLVFLCVQFSGMFIERWGRRAEPVVRRVAPVARVFPPGVAGWALQGAAEGRAGVALGSTALVAAYGLGFGLLLRRRLLALYRGEDLGETQAPQAAAPLIAGSPLAARASAEIAPGFLPGPVAAILTKEVRYMTRNSAMLLTLVLPVLLIAFLLPVWHTPRRAASHPPIFERLPGLALPAAIAYMFVILAPQAHNIFAYEGRGIQFFFLAPVRFRDVLLAKNVLFSVIVALESALVVLTVSLLERPPGAMILASTLLGLLFATIVHLLVGNWLSLQFPRRLEMGAFRQRASGSTVLIGLAAQLALGAMVAVVVLVARWMGQFWLVPIVFVVLSGLAFWAYWLLLDPLSRLAQSRREALCVQLCR